MNSIYISPGRYVQGVGAIKGIGDYAKHCGDNAMIIGGKTALSVSGEFIEKSFKENGITINAVEIKRGEVTQEDIDRLTKIAEEKEINLILGVGGGKALDTAKGVAYYTGSPVVIVPTTASNDSPCSSSSVVYSADGAVSKVLNMRQNPQLVLVDTEIIVNSPVRQFVAGMGDALATWFEASSCMASGRASNLAGGRPTGAALAIARLCYDTLLKYGFAAKMAVEKKAVVPSFEKVVEANILLSGIGFESGGISGAHGIVGGFSILHNDPKYDYNVFHGEEVAFGTLVLLVLEGKELTEINEVLAFCKSVGLPVSLKDLGLHNVTDEDLYKVAERACGRAIMKNLNYEVSPGLVFNAIRAADLLGSSFAER